MTAPNIARLGLEIDSSGLESGGQRAVRTLADIKAATGQAAAATDRMVSVMSQAFDRLRQGLAVLGVAFGALAALRWAKETQDLAARYETLGVVLLQVSKSAGYSAEGVKRLASELTLSGISLTQARNGIIKMIQAHLDLSKATELARVAQNAAVLANRNSSETFEHLIYAVQTGQSDMIRTIGLNVSWAKSYETLAASLNKHVSDLTEVERTTARMNAVIEAGKPLLGAYEASMGTAGKQVLSMQRYIEDLRVRLGELSLPAYTASVTALATALKSLANNFQAVVTWGTVAVTVLTTRAILSAASHLAEYVAVQAKTVLLSKERRAAILAEAQAEARAADTRLVAVQKHIAALERQRAAQLALATNAGAPAITRAAINARANAELGGFLTPREFQNPTQDLRNAQEAARLALTTEALAARATAQKEVTATTKALTVAQAELAAIQATVVAADNAVTAASQRMSLATLAAAGASKALHAALAFVGGPIGAAILALAGAWAYFAGKEREAAQWASTHGDRIERVRAMLEGQTKATKDLTAAERERRREAEELQKAQDRTAAQKATQLLLTPTRAFLPGKFPEFAASEAFNSKASADRQEAVRAIYQQSQALGPRLLAAFAVGQNGDAILKQWDSFFTKLATKYADNKKLMEDILAFRDRSSGTNLALLAPPEGPGTGKPSEEAERNEQRKKNLETLALQTRRTRELIAAQLDGEVAVRKVTAAHEAEDVLLVKTSLSQQNATVQRVAALNAAKAQLASLQQLIPAIEKARDERGAAERAYTAQLAGSEQALRANTDAERRLSLAREYRHAQNPALLDALADELEATDRLRQSTALLAKYQQETKAVENQIGAAETLGRALRGGAAALARYNVLQAQMAAITAAGTTFLTAEGQAIAAKVAVLHQLNTENQRQRDFAEAHLKTQRELQEQAKTQADTLAEPFKNTLRELQQSFSSFFEQVLTNGIRSFGDLANQIKTVFIRLLAQLASLQIGKAVAAQAAQAATSGLPWMRAGAPSPRVLLSSGAASTGTSTVIGASSAPWQLGRGFSGQNAWLKNAGIGFGVGMAAGQTGGAATGLLAGGLAGFATGGPVGAVVGAVTGLVSGLFGSAAKAREAERKMKEALDAFTRNLADFADVANPRSDLVRNLDTLKRQFEDLAKQAAEAAGVELGKGDVANWDMAELQRTLAFVQEQLGKDLPSNLQKSYEAQERFLKSMLDLRAAYDANVEAIKKAEELRQREAAEDLEVRRLRAAGHAQEADDLAFELQQRREFAKAARDAFAETEEGWKQLVELGKIQDLERAFREGLKRIAEAKRQADAEEARSQVRQRALTVAARRAALARDEQGVISAQTAAATENARATYDAAVAAAVQYNEQLRLTGQATAETEADFRALLQVLADELNITLAEITQQALDATAALARLHTERQEDLRLRILEASGASDAAEAERFRLGQQREMTQAQLEHWTEAELALLAVAHGLEALAFAAEQARRHTERLEDLQVRGLAASGQRSAAEDLAFTLGQQREMAQAVREGWSQAELATLAFVQALEAQARAQERATQAARAQQAVDDDLTERNLRATNLTSQADVYALFARQRNERIALMDAIRDGLATQAQYEQLLLVQANERKAFDQQQQERAQDAFANANAPASDPAALGSSPTVNLAVGTSEATGNRIAALLTSQLTYQASLPRIEALLAKIAERDGVSVDDVDEALGRNALRSNQALGLPPTN